MPPLLYFKQGNAEVGAMLYSSIVVGFFIFFLENLQLNQFALGPSEDVTRSLIAVLHDRLL